MIFQKRDMAEAKKNSRSTKFIKDFGIYAIGNLGSKIITILMIPLYTYFVERPSDYGYFDLCLQVCLLLTPLVTLQLRDGAFRFLLETQDKEPRTQIVSSVYRAIFFTTISTAVIAVGISQFYTIKYLWCTVLLLVVMAFYEVLAQVTRGLGNNKAFIAAGLIASFGIGLFSLIFVAWFKMGILGIFLANIFARLLSLALVELKMKTLVRFFSVKVDIRTITRDLLFYSIPLIPATLCGLLPHLTDRLFLWKLHSLEQSGIYAIAVRTSGIINNLAIIFYQTWQENAIQQYNSKDRDKFFSKVFNSYVFILAIALIGFIFVLKACPWIVSVNYRPAFIYLYPLALSLVIAAVGNYFYLPYQCAKDTVWTLPSVVIVVVLNIVFNFLLVPKYGIFGVTVTAILAYSAMTIFLWFNTRKYFTLHFEYRTIVPIAVMIVSIIPYYYLSTPFFALIYMLIAESCIIMTLPQELKNDITKMIKMVFSKSKNKKSD